METKGQTCTVCSRPTTSFISVCQNCREFFLRSFPQAKKWKCIDRGETCESFSSSARYCRFCRFQKCLAANIPVPTRLIKRESHCVPFFEKNDINMRTEELSLALFPKGAQVMKRIHGCGSAVEFANRMVEFEKMIANLSGPSPSEVDACLDVSLSDVLYNPECCSTRQTAAWDQWQVSSLKNDVKYKMKNTYARLISFYADFACAIPEMQQLHISDKLKLAQQNFMCFITLCKKYNAWKQRIDLDGTLRRTTRYTSPEGRGIMKDWYKELIGSGEQKRSTDVRKSFDNILKITDEEVVLVKIICLFTPCLDLSYEGVKITAVARNRYAIMLSTYINQVKSEMNDNERFQRLSQLLQLLSETKVVSEPASRLFESLVSKNIAELEGTLTYDLHIKKF